MTIHYAGLEQGQREEPKCYLFLDDLCWGDTISSTNLSSSLFLALPKKRNLLNERVCRRILESDSLRDMDRRGGVVSKNELGGCIGIEKTVGVGLATRDLCGNGYP
jgi:hypothetical protein